MAGITLFPTTYTDAMGEISRLRAQLNIANYNAKSWENKCKKLESENASLHVELEQEKTLTEQLQEALEEAVEEDNRKTEKILQLIHALFGSSHEGRRTIEIDESLQGQDATSELEKMASQLDLLESDLAPDPDAEATTAANVINRNQQTSSASSGKAKKAKSTSTDKSQQDGSVSGESAQPAQSTTAGKSQQDDSVSSESAQSAQSMTAGKSQQDGSVSSESAQSAQSTTVGKSQEMQSAATEQTPSGSTGDGQQTPSGTTSKGQQQTSNGPRILDPSPVRGINRLSDSLETVVDPVADIPEEERICPICGQKMSYLGQKIRKVVDYKPAEYFIHEEPYKAYECKACAGAENHKVVREAETPAVAAVPGSYLAAGFLAHVVADRYLNHLPIYRQEQELHRLGIPMYRQTINNNLILASDYLAPLDALIHEEILKYHVIHADETVWHVLVEPGKDPTAISYLWVYCTGQGAPHPAIYYDYAPGRGSRYPKAFLNYNDLVFTGIFHCDGYAGYNFVEEMDDVDRVACLAHIRRRFYQGAKLTPTTEDTRRSLRGYMFCNVLFELEERFADLTEQDRYIARLKYSAPVLDEFEAWLKAQTPGKNKFGTAVKYALDEFDRLRNILKNGNAEISNNRAENVVRPVVIGRKNSLFNTSVRGAEATARYYTLIQTALLNGLDPYEYFKWLFTKVPRMTDQSSEEMRLFLPWNAPESCRRREIPKRPGRNDAREFYSPSAYQDVTLPGLMDAIFTFMPTTT